MTINIPQNILGLKGQRVNEINLSDDGDKLVIHCSRDARRRAVDQATGKKGSINQHVRRQVSDIPLFGYRPIDDASSIGIRCCTWKCSGAGTDIR